jgi:hypothetical protein
MEWLVWQSVFAERRGDCSSMLGIFLSFCDLLLMVDWW